MSKADYVAWPLLHVCNRTAAPVASASGYWRGQTTATDLPVGPGCAGGLEHLCRDTLSTRSGITTHASDTPHPTGWTDSSMPDETLLICRDCGGCFNFSEAERLSFAVVGHRHPPSRCSGCRAARKSRQVASGGHAVAPRFRELEDTQTTVVCSSCGKSASVPFAARPGRSVYCAVCFQRRRVEGR